MSQIFRNLGITQLLLLALLGISFAVVILANTVYGAGFGYTTNYYSCSQLFEIEHCDQVPNKFTGQKMPADAQVIYNVSPSSADTRPGKIGNALPLTGYLGEYVTIPNSQKLNPPTFSVTFWMKSDPNFLLEGSIISHIDFSNTAGWLFRSTPQPAQRVYFSVANNNGILFTISALVNSSSFKNIVGTFDGKELKLFADGIIQNSTRFTGVYNPDPSVPLNFGLDSYDLGNAWKGYLDDVRYFGYALTDSQAQQIFQNKVENLKPLLGYWPMDNDTDDKSGNGHDGRIAIQAVSMAFAPDGRLFFTEKNSGEVRIMQGNRVLEEPFIKLKGLHLGAHQGLLGIALDPDFQNHPFVYLYYTYNENKTGDIFNRVMRFTDSLNRGSDEKILLDKIPADPDGEFAGGALAFGSDGKLYITVGHAATLNNPQNVSSLLGKVLRINSDGTIPSDNPYPGSPVYTLGHRNMFGIAFDTTGKGLVTENGEAHYDEINILEKGANYGFPTTQPPSRSPMLDNSTAKKPVRTYWHPLAPTQAIFYTGNKFPELKAKFLFGSYNEGAIYALRINGTNRVTEETILYFPQFNENIISIAESPSGELYFGGYRIYKLTAIHENQMQVPLRFIEINSNGPVLSNLAVSLANKTLSFDVLSVSKSGNSEMPTVKLTMPKSLVGNIFQVFSDPKNSQFIQNYSIGQQFKTANVGDVSVNIKLLAGVKGKIMIKGS